MNRTEYFNYIEKKLNELSLRIIRRGKLNILDLHIHSEAFFAALLNSTFGYNLVKTNTSKPNEESMDLVDNDRLLVAQVSAISTKHKVEKSLSSNTLLKYQGYRFLFVSIAKDADALRKMTFKNPYSIAFDPFEDIVDISALLGAILYASTDKQKEIYELVRKELGDEPSTAKTESNLATIVNILSKENLRKHTSEVVVDAF